MSSTKDVYKGQDAGAKEEQYVSKNNLYFTSEQKIHFYVCLQNSRRKQPF